MKTFKDLYQFIQDKPFGFYRAMDGHKSGLQIYSNKRQVNVLNDDELSMLNIVFDESADEVHIYKCDKPGYANYDVMYTFSLDDWITSDEVHNALGSDVLFLNTRTVLNQIAAA